MAEHQLSPLPESPASTRAFDSTSRWLDSQNHELSLFDSLTKEDGWRSASWPSPDWLLQMPEVVSFPMNKPSSQADADALDQWVTESFTKYAQHALYISGDGGEEDVCKVVEELVPVLSIGLHEIVRQVSQHCVERGVVLDKIWRTYVKLFECALSEAKASLKRSQDKCARVAQEREKAQKELADLIVKNPEQLESLAASLTTKFSTWLVGLEDRLEEVKAENASLRKILETSKENVRVWFPNFPLYKDSPLKAQLQAHTSTYPVPGGVEHKIAGEFMRIMMAMDMEGRRRFSYYTSSLLGLQSTRLKAEESVETLRDRRDKNRWKLEHFKARLLELQRQLEDAGGPDSSDSSSSSFSDFDSERDLRKSKVVASSSAVPFAASNDSSSCAAAFAANRASTVTFKPDPESSS